MLQALGKNLVIYSFGNFDARDSKT
jgi:hypothetical protein